MTTEHVILRCIPESNPRWSYYSMPTSVVGGADTQDAALAQYREALAFALDVEPHELPPVNVHTEREVVPDVWLRRVHDEHAADRQLAFEHLRRLLQGGPQEVADLLAQPSAGGDAILVAARPSDRLASVSQQMTDFDSLWILCPVPVGNRVAVAWTPLIGQHAEGRDARVDLEVGTFESWGVTDASTIKDFLFAIDTTGALDPAASADGHRVGVGVLVG